MTGNMHATLKSGDSALYFRTGASTQYPYGVEWVRSTVEANEALEQVSCGYRGYVWAVTASGRVLRLDGVTADTPQGTEWTDMERASVKHVSIGDAGEVWANDYNGNVFHVAGGSDWVTVPGNLVQVDVGLDRVIGVNNWGEIFFKNLQNNASGEGEWEQINGHLKMVTTSQQHVSWGIDNQDTVWFYSEHPCAEGQACPETCIVPHEPHDGSICQPINKCSFSASPSDCPHDWIPEFHDVKMVDLDVGRDGIVWGCTELGTPVVREGITRDQVGGVSWVDYTDAADQVCNTIAVCTSGDVWAITPDNRVMFREGIVYTGVEENKFGTHWGFETPSSMVPAEVACGGAGQVWMTDTAGQLYQKTGTQDRYNSQGDKEPVLVDEGPWTYISVSEQGVVYGLRNGEACARTGVTSRNYRGDGWECFVGDGDYKNFNAGNHEIWMVNVHNEVFYREALDNNSPPYIGNQWNEVPGLQTYVSTAEDGNTWAIDNEGQVWRWAKGEITVEEIVDNVEHGWTHVPAHQLVMIDVGYNAQVVGIEQGTANALFRTGITPENVMGDDWFVLDPGFNDVTMCANGLIWATKVS